MHLNLLAKVLEGLRTRDRPLREIAQASGVPYDTLRKIAQGTTPNPGVLHVQRLADFFEAQCREKDKTPEGAPPVPEAKEVAHG